MNKYYIREIKGAYTIPEVHGHINGLKTCPKGIKCKKKDSRVYINKPTYELYKRKFDKLGNIVDRIFLDSFNTLEDAISAGKYYERSILL